MAGSGQGQKKGQVLYDFMAQGDDEVTVAVGDEVIIIDDSKSEEWWQVRRLRNGKEGVVPSSYVEITGMISAAGSSGINAGRSTVEQNRLDEERLAKESLKAARMEESRGSGIPERGSSLTARDSSNNHGQQKSRRESGRHENGSSRSSKSSKSQISNLLNLHFNLCRTRSFESPNMDGSFEILQCGSTVLSTEGWQDQSPQDERCENCCSCCKDVC